MEYLIRNVEENDLPTLVGLCGNHAKYERADYDPNGKQELLKTAIFSEKQQLFCLVVESNSKLVGYASFTFDFSTWDAGTFLYLDCLYLEPDFRAMGIGEVVIEKLKEIALEHNCINIQWQTPTFNESAIRFYNRIGAHGNDKVRFKLQC